MKKKLFILVLILLFVFQMPSIVSTLEISNASSITSYKIQQTKTITVKKDGTGDYTRITDAVGSIPANNPDNIEYNIHIYPGTYDIANDFFSDGLYSTAGILLPNNVNLIGIGKREDIILSGSLPTAGNSLSISSAFSTLNLKYSNRLENLTVIAQNCRYAVHDESNGAITDYKRVVKNCLFIHKGNAKGFWKYPDAYGQGMSSGSESTFTDCAFELQDSTYAKSSEPNAGYICHNNHNFKKKSEAIFKKCTFKNLYAPTCFRCGSMGSGTTDNIKFYGCTFEGHGNESTIVVREELANSGVGIDYNIEGIANKNATVKVIDSTNNGWSANLLWWPFII